MTTQANGAKIELRDPQDLHLHAFERKLGEPPEGDEWNAFKDSIRERGMLQPLIITSDGRIMDGGWRWRAAKEWGLKEVPCIVREEKNVMEIIVGSLTHRKHMTKGAVIYLLIPILPKMLPDRKLLNLKKGPKNQQLPDTSYSFSGLAEKTGIGPDTISSAYQLYDLLHDPNGVGLMALYDKIFRGNLKPPIDVVLAYQKRCREKLEPELFNGTKNLWNCASYIMSQLPGLQEITNRDWNVEQSTFEFYAGFFPKKPEGRYHWSQLSEASRRAVVAKWTEEARSWKPELREAIATAIQNV